MLLKDLQVLIVVQGAHSYFSAGSDLRLTSTYSLLTIRLVS